MSWPFPFKGLIIEISASLRVRRVKNGAFSKLTIEDILQQAQNFSCGILTEWKLQMSNALDVEEDFGWVIHMSEYLDWNRGENLKSLFVEYDYPLGWQMALARVVERDLLGTGVELLLGIGYTGSIATEGSDFKIILARSLIAQLIAINPKSIEMVPEMLAQVQSRQTRCDAQLAKGLQRSWKTLLFSSDVTWEYTWSLLACVMKAHSRSVVMLLVGFYEERYIALEEGLDFFRTISFSDWRSLSTPSGPLGKFLVIGKPRIDTRHPEVTSKIGEGEEIKGENPKISFLSSISLIMFRDSMSEIIVFPRAARLEKHN